MISFSELTWPNPMILPPFWSNIHEFYEKIKFENFSANISPEISKIPPQISQIFSNRNMLMK